MDPPWWVHYIIDTKAKALHMQTTLEKLQIDANCLHSPPPEKSEKKTKENR